MGEEYRKGYVYIQDIYAGVIGAELICNFPYLAL